MIKMKNSLVFYNNIIKKSNIVKNTIKKISKKEKFHRKTIMIESSLIMYYPIMFKMKNSKILKKLK